MCRLLAGIMRTRRVLVPRMAATNQPRATLIYGKPPKDPIGVVVSCFIVYMPAPLGFMPHVIFFVSVSIQTKHVLFQETAVALTVMTVSLLGPSGYILSQLDDYRAED